MCVDACAHFPLEFELVRQSNKLTPLEVKAVNKPGLYGDGLGLYLQVSAFNTKAWVFRYTLDGRPRKMGLGALHTIGLAEVRKRAEEARKKLLDGIDPIGARDDVRAARKASTAKAMADAARVMTFKQCAEAYVKSHRDGWKNAKHAAQWEATFAETRRGSLVFSAITAVINDLPVSEIDTALVLKVLEPIWREKTETATRVRSRIELVLSWAAAREYRRGDNPARWRGHLQTMLPAPGKIARVEHHRAVPYREIGSFMAELRARPGVSARALEFTILTAARTSEAIEARWSEIDEVEQIWTVPADRMKAGREHRVPLSERALAMLDGLPREGDFLFPGAKKDRPLSNMAMLELVRGMRGLGSTVHGFRSTFRDWSAEQTSFPNEMCEIALAHTVSDKTEKAYRRGDMMERRRRLMSDWAAYCEDALGGGINVVALRSA